MPSTEVSLLSRVIFRPDEIRDLERVGFDPSYLSPAYAQAFIEVSRFLQEHGEMPSANHMVRRVKGITILRKCPKRRATTYWDTIFWFRWRNQIISGIQQVSGMFPDNIDEEDQTLDLSAITDAGVTVFSDIAAQFARDAGRPMLLGEMMKSLTDEYEAEEQGKTIAIPIPFEFLQDELRGWKGGQLYIVAGRPKTGKSWFVVISAADALKHNYRVLFVSLEMTPIEMARRLACVIGKISYNRVVKKTLSPKERKRYFGLLKRIHSGDIGKRLKLVGPGIAKTPEAVATLAKNFGADMVIVDAFYTMESQGDEFWKQVQHLIRKYRRLSLQSLIPWILVTQFNRAGGKGRRSARLDNLGFSDAIGQDANALIYVVRPTSLKKARQVDIILGEAREADDIVAFRHFWDFIKMNWEKVGVVEYGADEDQGV